MAWMVTEALVSQLEVYMRKLIVEVSIGMTDDQYAILASDIIEVASKVFHQLTVELDTDEADNIVIKLMEYDE